MVNKDICLAQVLSTFETNKRRIPWRFLLPFKMAQHSNFDRRRINGPESSSHPIFEGEEENKPLKRVRTSRKNDEIRPICQYYAKLVIFDD
jgi:hypothetical protein